MLDAAALLELTSCCWGSIIMPCLSWPAGSTAGPGLELSKLTLGGRPGGGVDAIPTYTVSGLSLQGGASPNGGQANPFTAKNHSGNGSDNPFAARASGDGSNPFAAKPSGSAPGPLSAGLKHGASAQGPAGQADDSNPFAKRKSGTGSTGTAAGPPSAASSARGGGRPPLPTERSPGGAGALRQQAGRSDADGDGEAAAEGAGGSVPPRLDLPALETGVEEGAVRDWAYLLFSALAPTSPGHVPASLVEVLREQLGVDEARAVDMQRLLAKHLDGGHGDGGRRRASRCSLLSNAPAWHAWLAHARGCTRH